MTLFTVSGHDNGLYFFYNRDDVRRCPACAALTRKWEEDLSVVAIDKKSHCDISYSYDGVLVVSRRFREVYEAEGMMGLEFSELQCGYFAVTATRIVVFDAKSRQTRFENKCGDCGEYESVTGATPAFLLASPEVAAMEFVRTDLEFGSGDEKGPVLVCGESAGEALRIAKMRGLELGPVRVT